MKKKASALKQFHTSNAKKGMGDNYPVGVRQNLGGKLDSFMDSGNKKKTIKKTKNQVV